MNPRVLIDNIVRQTTVLIAQLATSAGLRAPLAHIANDVFLNLTEELESAGLGRKVVADMFGLALRSYQLKVKRLTVGATDRDSTLWQSIYDFVCDKGVARRAEIQQHFTLDDDAMVRGILHDLVDSGLVFRSGRGDATVYRAVDPDERSGAIGQDAEALRMMLWIIIYRDGPLGLDVLAERAPGARANLEAALDELIDDGRVQCAGVDYATATFSAERCVIPMASPVGWEAAVYDHFQAMVVAICHKLIGGELTASRQDAVGGSTWSLDVWPGHPLRDKAFGLLGEVRDQASALRTEVNAHNASGDGPPGDVERVVFYVGQTVKDLPADTDADTEDT